MENIEERGLPGYFRMYLDYKTGDIDSIPAEVFKELPNDLKEYIDHLIDSTELEATKCKTPVADPAAGTYDSAQSVTLTSATDGATIYYTTDGSAPSTDATEYTGAITVSETTTIKAIAVKDEMVNSGMLTANYTIE